MSFSALPLHDAILASVLMEWPEARCTFKVGPVGIGAHVIVFSGVRHLDIPREQLWGPSRSINVVREQDGVYEIELQSGDVLRIAANAWEFHAVQP